MKKIRFLAFFFLAGCATPFTVPSQDALQYAAPPLTKSVQTTVYSPGFTNASLTEEGVALLGILKGGPETLRWNAAFEFFQALRASFPNARVVPRADLLRRARSDDQFDALNQVLTSYGERRVLDRAALRHWGEREGVRYLFVAQVLEIDKHSATQRPTLHEDGIGEKAFVFSAGPEHLITRVDKVVALSAEVWDTRCGLIAWKGRGRSQVSEAVLRERVRVEDIFIETTRDLVSEMDRTMWAKGRAAPMSAEDCIF